MACVPLPTATTDTVPCVPLPTVIARSERDGTRAETRFGLSAKRTSPFKTAGASVQSTAGSRGVRISECIIFSKYVDHSLKMSLRGRKELVESADCNVWVCVSVWLS